MHVTIRHVCTSAAGTGLSDVLNTSGATMALLFCGTCETYHPCEETYVLVEPGENSEGTLICYTCASSPAFVRSVAQHNMVVLAVTQDLLAGIRYAKEGGAQAPTRGTKRPPEADISDHDAPSCSADAEQPSRVPTKKSRHDG